MFMQFGILAPAEITTASDQIASTLLDPCAKATQARLARWIYMIVNEKVTGRDGLLGEASTAVAYGAVFYDRRLLGSHVSDPLNLVAAHVPGRGPRDSELRGRACWPQSILSGGGYDFASGGRPAGLGQVGQNGFHLTLAQRLRLFP
jgi:hypothetical protein